MEGDVGMRNKDSQKEKWNNFKAKEKKKEEVEEEEEEEEKEEEEIERNRKLRAGGNEKDI